MTVPKLIYISYDGILEPLGQSQVLRYLERLAPGHKIVLVSFEKPHDWQQIYRREILCDGKFGRLVPVGDAEALAAAMTESLLAKHDHEVLKARAQDFSIDKAVDQYLDVLFPKDNHSETLEPNQ